MGCAASTMPAVHSEAERLALGRRALQRREYNVAEELLKTYVANNAGGAEVDEAIELLGETYLHTKQWVDAQTQFERVLRDFPESDSSGTAAFHLGDALWGQARGPDFDQEFTQKAFDQWQSYLRGYPGHWANAIAQRDAATARARLATKLVRQGDLYLGLGAYGPAEQYYRRVVEEFGDTAQRARADLGLATIAARHGHRDSARVAFRGVEERWPGTREAREAAERRRRLERN